MPCGMVTSKNLQFVLVGLLLIVLESEITHGYHPFLLNQDLAWPFLWLIEHIVTQGELQHWAADIYSDLILSLVLNKDPVFEV